MGSQQLLMIVVGLIIVGLMIYAGIGIVHNYFVTSNRDQLISSLNALGVNAQEYYKKRIEMGGGGGSYEGWILPSEFLNTDDGQIRASVGASRVNFTATGTQTGMDDKEKVRITCRVDQNGIRMIVIN